MKSITQSWMIGRIIRPPRRASMIERSPTVAAIPARIVIPDDRFDREAPMRWADDSVRRAD